MQEHSSEGAAQEDAAPPSAEAPSQAQSEEALRQEVQELQARADQFLANWQRAQADFANYRKRIDGEQEERLKLANAALIASLLPVVDDLERALSSVAEKLIGFTWVDGIFLIYRKLMVILESHGLQEIKAEGQPFDPFYHQAIQEVEGEKGEVIAVVQKGYTLHQRLLRHALVTVGKEAAELPPAEDPAPPSESPSS